MRFPKCKGSRSTGGVDLFIRLAHTELGEGKRIKLMLSLIAICFISISVAIVFSLHRLQSNQKVHGIGMY
ncbi:unnamed protein product [Prunus armeniaca]|uniref:Uncharacterized protein n=1 Tax=Prunus armeniaca TaxID=36596 RepID=A0A6J5UPH4_PRUAR|nr:unnamed protein product [Prunus armeniaca]